MERPERDEVFQDRGKYIRIYRDLGEGLWKVARDMCNSDKPAFLPALMV